MSTTPRDRQWPDLVARLQRLGVDTADVATLAQRTRHWSTLDPVNAALDHREAHCATTGRPFHFGGIYADAADRMRRAKQAREAQR